MAVRARRRASGPLPLRSCLRRQAERCHRARQTLDQCQSQEEWQGPHLGNREGPCHLKITDLMDQCVEVQVGLAGGHDLARHRIHEWISLELSAGHLRQPLLEFGRELVRTRRTARSTR